MIHVHNLTKHYGPIRALDEISFDVREGEIVGFLGPNGAGKSTTLRILTGFLPGDSGTVTVAGHDVSKDSLTVRQSIGYLPEGVPLYPELRVIEFLRFRSRLKGIPLRERASAIDRVLEQTATTDVRRRIVGTLSKGYRQRVGLSDALLGQPPVLILDEPTVGLDPEQLQQFRTLIRAVGEQRTVLLSTHILSEVDMVCDGAIIIHQGRIAAQDSAKNLRERVQAAASVWVEIAGPATEVESALDALGRSERIAGAGAPGASSDAAEYHTFRVWAAAGSDPRTDIFALVRDRGWTLRELRREEASLEDAFLEIIGESGDRRAPVLQGGAP